MVGGRLRGPAVRATVRIAWDLLRTWAWSPPRDGESGGSAPVTVRRAASAQERPRRSLRLVTWNIHRAYNVVGVAGGVQRLLDEVEPDLLLLQEVPVWPSGPWWEQPSVRDLLGSWDVGFAAMHRVLRPSAYYPFVAAGQAVLSRRPLDDVRAVTLPQVSRAKLGRAHVIRRLALLATVSGPAGGMTVADVHLENTARPSGRAAQTAELLRALDDPLGLPTIVAGDFNDALVPFEGVDRLLRRRGFEGGPVRRRWPGIDRVYGRGMDVVRCEALEIGGSDHRPVVAELEMVVR